MSRVLRRWRLSRFMVAIVGCLAVVLLNPATSLVTATDLPPVVLPGHVLPGLGTMSRLGALPLTQSLTLTIALHPGSPTGLSAAARARAGRTALVSNLSAADVGRLYGQSSGAVDAVGQFFANRGFTVFPARPDQLSFQVQGNVDQIQRSLGVVLGTYDDGAGHRFYAADRDPELPANVAGSVQAILGLDDYPLLRPTIALAQDLPGGYTPADMRSAYNINPLYAQGYSGLGQTIGIIGCDTFAPSDIQAFASLYGLPTPSITTVNVDGGPVADGSAETTLDLEWSSAIAPQAALVFYGFSQSSQCSLQGMYDAIAQASTDNRADVITISLGACEANYGTSLLDSIETRFAAAAAQSQGVFVASGDIGADAECANSRGVERPVVAVSYPASSAYVTAVGGTALHLASTGGYGSEAAWGTAAGGCSPTPCGSGGGISSFVAEPSWQSSANPQNLGGKRGMPDVAWNADPVTGNVLYYEGALHNGIGGTSIGSPQWAGLAALANQVAGHRLGQLAPALYSTTVQSLQTTACAPFHDITTGGNSTYSAGPGWDLVTGWGSPNAANLVQALVGSPPTATASVAAAMSAMTPGPQVFLPLVLNGSMGIPSSEPTPSPEITPTAAGTTTPTAESSPTAASSASATPLPTQTSAVTATPTVPTVTSTPSATGTPTSLCS